MKTLLSIIILFLSVMGFAQTLQERTNSLSSEIKSNQETFVRNVVYEETTGTWCGHCPRGIVGLNTMYHNITNGTFIGIAVHGGDLMEVSGYTESLEVQGYPNGKMNRKIVCDPDITDLQYYYGETQPIPAQVKVEINNQSWSAENRHFTAEAEVYFSSNLDGVNYNIGFIVTEDSVTGPSPDYDQTNYYSGSEDLIDWDGTNWKNLPNPVPASQMVYNHVARQIIGGFGGVPNVIPSTVAYGTPYTYTFEGNIPSDQDESNIHFVALVINNTTGEIENAIQEHLIINNAIEEAVADEYKIYPNPTNGTLNIEHVEGAAISVYNMLGEIVYQITNVSATTTMNLSALQAGNYIVQIVKDNKVTTKKVVLTK